MNSPTGLVDLSAIDVVILGWQVALFFVTIAILLVLGRTKLTLITTYLFTLFWGFYFYWGSYIASAGVSILPLILYAGCGIFHVLLTLVALYRNDGKPSIRKEMV